MIRSPRRPALLVEIPIEGNPTLRLVADTEADERRLLGWARRAFVVENLGELILRALDELELLDDRNPWQPPS